MNGKRIAVIKPDHPVPKKTKAVPPKNQETAQANEMAPVSKSAKETRSRRSTATQKPRKKIAKKIADEPAVQVARSADIHVTAMESGDDAIRLRAYFISERRRRFALPGDAESDWLEAKQQLSEGGRR
jgi:hypothetical protein